VTQEKNELDQVDSILQSALMRPAGERGGFLDEACAGNEALRLQVEALLAHYERAKQFLEDPPVKSKNNWKIGSRIDGRWEIQKILGGPGSSGMGIVYVVYDHKDHEVFAAKTFQDGAIARDQVTVSRFQREALAWVNLDRHENITRAHALRTIDGKPFLFLDYITGGDLSAWITEGRLAQDLVQAVRFAIQFCDGMSHALAKGIRAHRDIKPQNCLISADRILKITDFGLVKVLDDFPTSPISLQDEGPEYATPLSASETQMAGHFAPLAATIIEAGTKLSETGVGMGTARYMAPEQFADAKHVDVRADIYSFGVMLFEMVTGRLPFTGRSWQELSLQHASSPAPALQSSNDALNRLVEKCLAKDPSDRFPDFGAARLRLTRIFGELTNEPAPEPSTGRKLLAEELYNKGLSLQNLGHSSRAIECYDEALKLRPNYAAAWNNKATALNGEAALYCLDQALKINPRSEESWYNKGVRLSELGRAREAEECYRHVVEINPLNDVAWNDRGVTLAELGRVDDAIESYNRALAANPANEKAWLNKGTATRNSGRLHEALEFFDEALKINPHLTDALQNKGVTLSEIGRHQDAVSCFTRVIERGAASANAWANKGRALRAMRRPQEALECYDTALGITGDDPDIWSDRGNALADLGRRIEAAKCFDQAIALKPQHDKAWYNRANELRKLGRLPEAIAAYDKALESAPTLYQALVNKGLTLSALGRSTESLNCYDSALKLEPNQATIWFNRGNLLFQMKRADEAIASYDRALDLDPSASQIWNNKGAALVGFRNYREALGCFEKAAALGDRNAAAAINECRRLLEKSSW
jgi:tetratricopeptide (TPR) repeat protein